MTAPCVRGSSSRALCWPGPSCRWRSFCRSRQTRTSGPGQSAHDQHQLHQCPLGRQAGVGGTDIDHGGSGRRHGPRPAPRPRPPAPARPRPARRQPRRPAPTPFSVATPCRPLRPGSVSVAAGLPCTQPTAGHRCRPRRRSRRNPADHPQPRRPPPGNGSASGNPAPKGPALGQPRPSTQPASPAPASPPVAHPSHPQPQSHASSGMPSWLKSVLLAVGLLALVVFAAELLLLAWRGRRRRGVTPGPASPSDRPSPRAASSQPGPPAPIRPPRPHPSTVLSRRSPSCLFPRTRAASSRPASSWPTTTVSSSPRNKQDDTICVLCPPDENPADILRVARLVLPEGHYGKLAEHLGLPATLAHEPVSPLGQGTSGKPS